MKYEVIGWVDDDDLYPVHRLMTAPVSHAIITEIQKNGYLFGGDAHDYHIPLLNDGTCVSLSWRSWGGIMARAYGQKGDYAYMFGYMDSLLDPAAIKYPQTGHIDETRIVPRESLAETFVMHLADDMFDAIKAGTKTIEVRLFDEKRQQIDVDDYIEFRRSSGGNERLVRRVADLYLGATFTDIFEKKYYDDNGNYVNRKLELFGTCGNATVSSMVDKMYSYYTREQEDIYGAVAFILTSPHSCRTRLYIATWSNECITLFDRQISDPTISDEEKNRLTQEFCDDKQIEKALQKIADGFTRDDYFNFIYGENTDYDPDVNVMIGKTIKELYGKEEQCKEIQRKYCAVFKLEIKATFVKNCDEPKQNLSLNKDVIAFLHKSGIIPEFRISAV